VKTKSRISPRKRTQAARLIRKDNSYPEVSRITGISQSTLERWMSPTHGDAEFLMLVNGAGTLQVGPVRLQADHDAPLLDDVPDESLVWVARCGEGGEPEVLGSVHVDGASHLRCVFVTDESRARSELAAGRLPHDPEAKTFALRADALVAFADPGDLALLCRLTSDDRADAFRAWCGLWRFRAQESKDVRLLGEHLWEAQNSFIEAITEHDHTYSLKATKLGLSTIAMAYAAFCARVRDGHARVHLFSRAERAALDLLAAVRFGLDGLPAWLQLPMPPEKRTQTQKMLTYDAGGGETRLVVAYPTSDAVAVEATATHSHVDEWADMPRPDVIYSSLEPTFSAPGCTSLILTTGSGPANPSAEYWRRCLDGQGLHYPLFIPATARPGRDAEWLARKRKEMLANQFRTEYALTWQDAIAGVQGFAFAGEDIDQCSRYPRYGPNSRTEWPLGEPQLEFPHKDPGEPRRRCRYLIACDIGVKDATVIVVLDVTSTVQHVAHYERHLGLSYPAIGQRIADVGRLYYPAPIVIESNSMGAAVISHLEVANRVIPFATTQTSKARAIEALASALQHYHLQYDARALPQLDTELRGYQIPDENVTQDSVMALALAIDSAPEAYSAKNQPGRIMAVIQA
jgi:hypothetical protein